MQKTMKNMVFERKNKKIFEQNQSKKTKENSKKISLKKFKEKKK